MAKHPAILELFKFSGPQGLATPEMIARLEGAKDPRAEGIRICVELIEQLQEIEGVAGTHLMAPRGEQAIAQVIAESGIRRPG